jgi:tRNA-specific 2-thiouridylase
MQPLADQIGIPLYIIDLRKEFQRVVVDYFIGTYAQGKTPNPCLVCNPSIKFDVLYNKSKQLGASRIATGHYARIDKSNNGRMRLLAGVDDQKEQSYFLSRLSQSQLARIDLPIGSMTKTQTIAIASEKNLVPATSQESQDICFIKNGAYGDFLASQAGFTPRGGPIEDVNGRVIGKHNGLHRFTIGQRRGINCPAATPYYVVRIDTTRNSLIVGDKSDLITSSCRVSQINWIAAPPKGPLPVKIRIRYRHKAVSATLTPEGNDIAEILFKTDQTAVTPGQGAVFYDGKEVLGGGWLE